MVAVGSGAGGDVHRAGRSELVRKIERGLADLKFVDRAGRNIFGGGADGFVADVHAVHFDARGASEAAADGNRREADFGGIEIGAILNLHARFELREIEEVAAVHRQVFDLFLVQDALHAGLFGIDSYRLLGDGDYGIGLAHLQADVDAGNFADPYDDALLHRLESGSFDADGIISRDQCAGIVGAGGGSGDVDDWPVSVFVMVILALATTAPVGSVTVP